MSVNDRGMFFGDQDRFDDVLWRRERNIPERTHIWSQPVAGNGSANGRKPILAKKRGESSLDEDTAPGSALVWRWSVQNREIKTARSKPPHYLAHKTLNNKRLRRSPRMVLRRAGPRLALHGQHPAAADAGMWAAAPRKEQRKQKKTQRLGYEARTDGRRSEAEIEVGATERSPPC